MLASLDEQVVQQPADRLGRVAVALMLGRKGEADLGLARILGLDMGPTVTDQLIRVAQGHGELEPLPGRIGMHGLQLLQELPRLAGPVGRLPALVAGGLGVGPVGDEGVQVLGPESAQHQPLCGQGREGNITHRLPPLPTMASRRLCGLQSNRPLLPIPGTTYDAAVDACSLLTPGHDVAHTDKSQGSGTGLVAAGGWRQVQQTGGPIHGASGVHP